MRWGWIAATTTATLVGGFYFWLASLGAHPFAPTRSPADIYGHLTQALLGGHLHLQVEPDPGLLALADPYDSAANRAFRVGRLTHDASLFEGHFYYYFGLAPVLVLFAPFRLLTGFYLREDTAVPLLLAALAAVSWLACREILRGAGVGMGPALSCGLIAFFGLAQFSPFLCRTPETYETAIASGALFGVLGVYALARALAGAALDRRFLLAAGLSFGLAFASRPTLLLDVWLLAVASVVCLARRGRPEAGRGLLALWLPWLVIAALVLAYNWARFHSAFEFGGRYMLGGRPIRLVHTPAARFLPLNLYLYLLAPPLVSPEFPFLTLAPQWLPARPAGYLIFEPVAGLLPCSPLVLLGALWPFLRSAPARLRLAGCALLGQGVLLLGLVACIRWTTTRYMLDFIPFFALAAGLSWAWLVDPTRGGPVRRRVLHGAAAALVGYGTVVVGAASLTGRYGVLGDGLCRRLEAATAPFQRMWLRRAGGRYGYLDLKVALRDHQPGDAETLVATGTSYNRRVVCIRYFDDHRVVLGFASHGREQFHSVPVRLEPGVPHDIGIQMGTLLPLNVGALARVYPGRPVEDWRRRLRIVIDGQEVLSTVFDFDPPATYLGVGADWFGPEYCADSFSGTITSWRRHMPHAAP